MVGVAQLARAPDRGSGGRGFETHYPPHTIEYGPVAQLAEQGTLNPKVQGSNPCRSTIQIFERPSGRSFLWVLLSNTDRSRSISPHTDGKPPFTLHADGRCPISGNSLFPRRLKGSVAANPQLSLRRTPSVGGGSRKSGGLPSAWKQIGGLPSA